MTREGVGPVPHIKKSCILSKFPIMLSKPESNFYVSDSKEVKILTT